MNEEYKPSYKWNLTDLDKVKKNGLKVFSCFACGGGLTMGYKLAGFDVIGANDIDPEMAWHYQTNHKPKHYFLEDIRKFKLREDLPKELYDLDILDGSPPCSSFSMAGSREKGWGKKKQFREGQALQTLDDLFFDFIELGRKLRPKVIIAENVKGMLHGNAKGYVKQIIGLFNTIGYDVQLFLLNAASMGVPQKRERVFFIGKRKDLNLPDLKLGFYQKAISLSSLPRGGKDGSSALSVKQAQIFKWCKSKNEICGGKAHTALFGKRSMFNTVVPRSNEPSPTIAANCGVLHWLEPRTISNHEASLIGSYPLDYIFNKKKKDIAKYMIGMSVPPLMTYGVAKHVYEQWFKGK